MRYLYVLRGFPASGKAQPLNSKILYADGIFRTMKDVKIGDKIIDGLGNITNVIGVFPQGLLDTYKLTFTNGSSCLCSDNHLWKVRTNKLKTKYHKDKNDYKYFKILTTNELISEFHKKSLKQMPHIPINKCITFDTKQELPLSPWLLGALLGDGCFTSKDISFSTSEQFMVDKLNVELWKTFPNLYFTKNSHLNYTYNLRYKYKQEYKGEKSAFVECIKLLGLYGLYSHEKFIPRIYLTSTVQERKELLYGLFDTDGSTGNNGIKTISTSSKSLCDDIIFLCRSLGYNTTTYIYVKNNKNNYNIHIHTNDCVFTSAKHLHRYNIKGFYHFDHITIKNIEYMGKMECQCIMVDSKDHTYITDDFIVTHNTQFIEQYKHLNAYTLSSDKYRLMSGSIIYDTEGHLSIPQDVSGRAWKRLKEDLEYRMERGEFTIIDATHMHKDHILEYRKLCKKYFYKLCVVNFDTDIRTCIENNHKRINTYNYVPDAVIINMEEKKEELPNSIRQINSDEFINDVYSKYNPIDFDKYENIWIIGDIHGCYEPLKRILNRVNMEKDAVIFVGDYFDRGIQNSWVFFEINKIIDNPNVYCCIGNHELRVFDYLWGKDVSRSRFGNDTLKQFEAYHINNKELESFCKKLIPCVRFYYNENYVLVSHAGVSNGNINIMTPEVYFTKGIGTYEDMDKVCGFYRTHNKLAHIQEIQIFGHRNNNDVPIKINDMCYNVCGFPEYGGTLKALKMYKHENTIAMEEIYEYNKIFNKEGLYHAIAKYPNRFPIEDVETLVGAMRHSKYINEHEFGHISSFNFTKEAFYDDIWDGINIRARGLFINTHTNKIVARSYNKFFNLGQHECSTIDKFEAPITLYKKYDGFLGIIGYDEETDNLVFCSKSTIAPYGDYANLFESKIRPLIKDEEQLKDDLREKNISLVFECIAPKEDEHLIKYDKDMCILLDVIHNTIEYQNESYNTVRYFAQELFDGVVAKEYMRIYATIGFFTDDIGTLKSRIGFEGFVAVDNNNQMFKLKTYEFEKLKFIRTQKDYYTTIKQKAGNHEIKKPDKYKFEKRYEQVYDIQTIDEAYKEVCEHIDTLNLTYQEK